MRLPGDLGHLTYCLNIHPTQSWAEAEAALTGPVRAVKEALSPDAPFAVGLRFSAETLAELADPARRARLRAILEAGDCRPVTMNGFPYGPFHGTRVKAEVYQPDWRTEERVAYTNGLADLMAELNPAGEILTISTVPGSDKANGRGHEAAIADNMLRSVAHLVGLAKRTGRTVALAIEPEPACILETVEECVDFFAGRLFCDAAAARLAELAGISRAEAVDALPRHLGLCYDVCHAAVEFEDPAASLAALKAAAIPVHKLQLSSAIRLLRATPQARTAVRRFDEPVYLHQVVRRRNGEYIRHLDLPDALAAGGISADEEWRIHFHVPVFLDRLPEFDTTQGFLAEILALHRKTPISHHLEVETYTWDVLPEEMRAGSVDAAVTRELEWVRDRLLA
jgi:sugar phosphate isomerase/epimerase